ncbi:Dihydrofolate reductase [Sterolibacterium denitrificans]|uniref:Dihydrofolate reductase n=1 Tax=Sterolibacterium denitrificans TaxID=157592 RepID=A0A7Z7HPP4_9PROT|nr:dihydrofolate reductase [Sterolibacterium denitrificans]SMB22812.1 Dihydrofolate reductase [Sterolibacterium denitrificans]
MPPSPHLTLIAAVARNGVIGLDNALPWRLPEDLRRFKALTLGHPVIMGRKTWESLGRPLPGRSNIVISRDPQYVASGATTASTLEQAIAAAAREEDQEIFVIGGAEIYRLALPLAQRLQLTEIDRDFAGDARFPAVDQRIWRETSRERHRAEAGFDYAFVTYERS